jgi:polysaccharide pyruvyl transferase WcaK-like protein
MIQKSKKKIALFGVAGFNRGDDAISACLIKAIEEKYGNHDWVVSVQHKGKLNKDTVEELLLARHSIFYHFKLIAVIARSDFVIIGGGSIIQDEFGAGWIKGITSIYAEILLLSKFFKKPVITAPIGVDKLFSKKGKAVANYVLNKCSAIFVRDHISLENAKQICKTNIPIHLSSDPVITYQFNSIAYQPDILILSPAFEGRHESFLFDVHKIAIEIFLNIKPNGRCIIVAMDNREKEDSGRAEIFINTLDPFIKSRCQLIVPANYKEAADLLVSGLCLFAMRLHAMIFAAGYTPVMCLSRGTKTDAISKQLCVDKINFTQANDIDLFKDAVKNFYLKSEDPFFRKSLIETSKSAKMQAAKNFNLFLEYLPMN